MPRPPARRDRINALTRLANEQPDGSGNEKEDLPSEPMQNPKGRKQKTALELYRQTFEDSLQLSNEVTLPLVQQYQFSHTPLNKTIRNGLESSPKIPGTETRPATRARGYSSTLLAGRMADPSSRITSTPGFESSILSNFKRRQRQPSILQIVQLDASSDLSDFDDEDFLGGLSPQDESTPLRLARAAAILPNSTILSPSAVSARTPVSKTSQKRKRSAKKAPADDGLESEIESPTLRLVSESRTPEPQRPVIENTIELHSQTLAAPRSSSPSSPGTDLDREANGNQEIVDKHNIIHTKVSTVALQEKFLPRRRARGDRSRSHGGISDSDSGMSDADDSDDDELARSATKRTKRSARPALVEARYVNKKPASRTKANGSNDQYKQAMGSDKTDVPISRSDSRRRVTYGSRHVANLTDKENDLSDGSALSSPPLSVDLDSDIETPKKHNFRRTTSQELQLQAKKFAEIDRWQMEFEDVLSEDSQ